MKTIDVLLIAMIVVAVVLEIKSCAIFKIDCDEGIFVCTKRFLSGEPIYRESEKRWLIWHDGLKGKWACIWVTNPKCTKIKRNEAGAIRANQGERP